MSVFRRFFQFIKRKPRSHRAGFVLNCAPLETRLTPTAKPFLVSPVGSTTMVSATEIVAQIQSTNPIRDLVNVTNYLGLGSAVDLARSELIFSTGSTSYISISLKPGANPSSVAAAYAPITSLFNWVTPNYVYSPSLSGSAGWLERVPNDPIYPQQWHLPAIKAPSAWDTTFGGNPALTVAVFDGGIDINHPDLASNIFRNIGEIPNDGIDNDGNGYADDVNGWDFSTDTNNVNPDNALTDTHGTQVAGLLAATIDNALGVAGLAGRVKILPMKVVGNGALTSLSLARAAAYSVQAGAKIITCSINIDPLVGDPSFEATANFVYNRGLIWFNSAGNYNASNPPRQSFEQILFVSATDRNDRKASYSNYGTGIDISAPGGDLGDGLVTTTNVAAGGIGTAFGTSMATPLAAATAALIWSANPTFTRDQVASRLLTTATDIDPFNTAYMGMLGSGRIDAGKAVNSSGVTKIGPVTGLPTAGVPVSGTLGTITLRLDAPLDPATVTSNQFELRGAGEDNLFDTSDDSLISLSIVNDQPIRIGTNEIHLAAGATLGPGLYRFTAKSGGLRDPFGLAVDGDGDGSAGGDLVRTFGVATAVDGTAYEDTNGDGSLTPGEPELGDETVFVDLNGNGVLDGQSGSNHTPVNIPDDPNSPITSQILISGLTRTVDQVTVSVTLTHPQPGDLRIALVSPEGTRIILSANRFFQPFSTNQTWKINFDDAASQLDEMLNTIRPHDPLGTFRGENGNGLWTLEITDTTPGDSGSLQSWSLNVTDEPTAVTDDHGRYTVPNNVPPGIYSILPVVDSSEQFVTGTPLIFANDGKRRTASVGIRIIGAVTGQVVTQNGGPVAGATIYDDANGNGKYDASELSVVTSAGGFYSLPGLSVGTHTLRIGVPLGYDLQTPAGGAITVTVSSANNSLFGNNFIVLPRTGSPLPSLGTVTPDIRTTSVQSFDIMFNLPVNDLTINDLHLTRNNLLVSLDGATLIGSKGVYQLIGTADETALEGAYRLVVNSPNNGPSSSTSWTVDLTPPAVQSLNLSRPGINRPVSSATITFTEPVSGLSLANFSLMRNGVLVPLTGATLSGTGAVYTLSGLTALSTTYGNYILSLVSSNHPVSDLAGNLWSGTTSMPFVVGDPPPVFQDRIVTATDAGRATTINVTNTTGTVLFTLMPFGPSFLGGARVTTADVNGDSIADIIVGSGPGRVPEVRVYDGRNGVLMSSFFAFEASFAGGINVATADFDGNGTPELIISPDQGGGPRVRVVSSNGVTVYADFFGIADPDFRGGARATAGDLNGDGTPDLIVSAGIGGGPRIAAYDGKTIATSHTHLFNDFFVFESSLRNGVFLTSIDVNNDGYDDLVAGGGPGGGPRVFALSGKDLTSSGTQTTLANFFAGSSLNRSGTILAAKDLNGDGKKDLLATDGPTIRGYLAPQILSAPDAPAVERQFNPFGSFGGVFVG